MSRRAPTPFDLLVSQADRALRTLTGDLTNSGRANPASPVADAPLTESEKRHAAGLMRVNHAGEVAAQGLYQGQALTARLGEVREAMQQAAIEEVDHLEWCEERLEELDSQPSALSPLWYAGAFAIGATAGLIGDRWSLGFVAETEHQVVKHLDNHLDELPETDEKSRAIVEQMKEDEARHGATAQSAGGRTLPLPIRQLMTVTARIMTRSAYWF